MSPAHAFPSKPNLHEVPTISMPNHVIDVRKRHTSPMNLHGWREGTCWLPMIRQAADVPESAIKKLIMK